MISEVLEIDDGIKRKFLAMIPAALHAEAEEYLKNGLADGRFVWRKGASACQV